MPRRAAKVDANQPEIVDGLRAIGCTVRSTAAIGRGFPDLVVGYRGTNFLIEVKDGSKRPSARALLPEQQDFFDGWRGQVAKVESLDEAIEVVTRG